MAIAFLWRIKLAISKYWSAHDMLQLLTACGVTVACDLVGHIVNSDALRFTGFHSQFELHKFASLLRISTICQR